MAAAALLAGRQTYPSGALYMVATPIGNLADISLRALHVLQLVDVVACEDTRHTSGMLRAYGIHKTLIAAHEHNEREVAQSICERLSRGERVAYLSDAGTPAISDPGCWLSAAAHAGGYRVVPLPGASSVVTAISASGVDARQGFDFIGFLPSQTAAAQAVLANAASAVRPMVLFEAPHRIEKTAKALGFLGGQSVTVCRELTKQFESIHTLAAAELPAWLAADPNRCRGEFVLIIHPAPVAVLPSEADAKLDSILLAMLAHLPLKTAVGVAVQLSGQSKNTVYARAIALKPADRLP